MLLNSSESLEMDDIAYKCPHVSEISGGTFIFYLGNQDQVWLCPSCCYTVGREWVRDLLTMTVRVK